MDLTKVLSVVKSKKTGFFAAGVLFGTAGIKALSSKEQQESNFFLAKMQKKFIRTVQQLFFVQKNV